MAEVRTLAVWSGKLGLALNGWASGKVSAVRFVSRGLRWCATRYARMRLAESLKRMALESGRQLDFLGAIAVVQAARDDSIFDGYRAGTRPEANPTRLAFELDSVSIQRLAARPR